MISPRGDTISVLQGIALGLSFVVLSVWAYGMFHLLRLIFLSYWYWMIGRENWNLFWEPEQEELNERD